MTAKLPCSALLHGMLCHLAATSGPLSTAIPSDAAIRAARGKLLAASVVNKKYSAAWSARSDDRR